MGDLVRIEREPAYGITYDEGITLASEDLDGVDSVRMAVRPFHLNDRHVVSVDGEHPIWIARDADQPEAIPTMVVSERGGGLLNILTTYRLP